MHLRTVVGTGGGPEKTLLHSHHYARDYTLQLMYLYPAGDPKFDLTERARETGAELIAIPERGPVDPFALYRIKKLLSSYSPHILHSHDYKTNILAILFGRAMGIPVVTTAHGYGLTIGRLGIYYRLERWALRRADRVMVVSSDIYNYMLAVGVAPSRCRLIDNGVDLAAFQRTITTAEGKSSLGYRSESLLIAAVGRLVNEKAFEVLIDAAAMAINSGVDLELVILGEGPERSRLETQIAKYDLGSRVRLLGYRKDVAVVLQACDVFILSSRREASPNVVLEAMALELPVIATRVASVPDMIRHGENGLLVDPEDAHGLSQSIYQFAVDPHFRLSAARSARLTVESRYSFADRMQKEFAVYDEIVR